MAPDNQLSLLWFSWIQFRVQHHLSVSFISVSLGKTRINISVYLQKHYYKSSAALSPAAESLTKLSYRYCRMLEEGCFRGRTADFVFMFLFGGVVMNVSFFRLAKNRVNPSFAAMMLELILS